MKLTTLIMAFLPSAIHAERAADPVAAFGRQMTYMIDGVSMYVNCRCNLDETKGFDIGVQAGFKQGPQAAVAAFDVAQGYCATRFGSAVSIEAANGQYSFELAYKPEQNIWHLEGRCA